MRPIILTTAALAGVALAACAGQGGASEADLAMARSLTPAFMKAAETKDADAAAALYAEDAMVMPPGAPPVQGRAAIQAFWRKMLLSAIRRVTLLPGDLRMADDIAFERSDLRRPERATDGEVLVSAPPAPLEGYADRLELLPEPSDSDREDEAPSGERVERRDLLRGHDGRTVGYDVGAHAEPDAAGRAGEEGERRQRLVELLDHAHVARLRVRATVVGVDRPDARRRDQVVAHPDRIHAERLGASRETRERRGARESPIARERDPEAHERALARHDGALTTEGPPESSRRPWRTRRPSPVSEQSNGPPGSARRTADSCSARSAPTW